MELRNIIAVKGPPNNYYVPIHNSNSNLEQCNLCAELALIGDFILFHKVKHCITILNDFEPSHN